MRPIRQGESPFQSGFKSHSHKRFTFVFTGESGYTLAFANRIAIQWSQRAKQGRFERGWYHYHRTVLRGSETLRPGSERLCRFWVLVGCAPEERREPAGQRHAHARRCSGGVSAPLGCVIPLFFPLTTLMSFTVLLNRFVGTQKIERLFFSSGAFLEQSVTAIALIFHFIFTKTVVYCLFLRRWAARLPHGAFRELSQLNVDGQFASAGFDPARICEIHGSIHYLQCLEPCAEHIWPADSGTAGGRR